MTSTAPDTTALPNVVVIYTDDLGFGDVGFTGGRDVATPHLDALAASGASMQRWYTNSPVCSPSRAALLTGRHPAHAGVGEILGSDRGRVQGLWPQQTLPGGLAAAGYRTALVGKWHLGTSAESSPLNQGFDRFFGFLAGCVDYYSHIMYWGRRVPVHDLWQQDGEVWRNGEYLTTMISDAAVELIEEGSERGPWFAMVSYNAPHYPLHAPAEYVERFAHLPEDRRMIAAMIAAVDDGVGAIVEALERTGQRENTIIFFSSDNGPSAEERNWLNGEEVAFAGGSTGGLRGHKGSLYEGGIRVPALWSWPARIPAGQRVEQSCQMSDVTPTLLAAAGLRAPEDLDGHSLLPLLMGGEAAADRLLFWEYEDQRAVSDGTWKLVTAPRDRLGEVPREPDALFRLDGDRAESTNLIGSEPGHVQRLAAALLGFDTEVAGWRERLAAQGPTHNAEQGC